MHWEWPKKSHQVKKMALGGNETPKTYGNQKYIDLDYVRNFQVNLKFPLTSSRQSTVVFASFTSIIRSHTNKTPQELYSETNLKSATCSARLLSSFSKLHIVTDVKVTIKILKKGTLALSLSQFQLYKQEKGKKISDIECVRKGPLIFIHFFDNFGSSYPYLPPLGNFNFEFSC